jgi:hypothetical protein
VAQARRILACIRISNLVPARAALANKVRQCQLEERKQQELRRTPFAILDEPAPELAAQRPLNPSARQELTTRIQVWDNFKILGHRVRP